MLTPIASPQILSQACHQFSASVDLAVFDPARTPLELGVTMPAALARAVRKRQADFVAGRFAALSALRDAGYTGPSEIGMREDRSPIWPPGFIGTITHTQDYVSAAAARTDRVRALGRDTEQSLDVATALEIQSQSLSPKELKLLAAEGFDAAKSTSLVFSAKESLYKALHPLVGRFFDFKDAEVVAIAPGAQTLQLRLTTDLSIEFKCNAQVAVRFVMADLVHTAVEIPNLH